MTASTLEEEGATCPSKTLQVSVCDRLCAQGRASYGGRLEALVVSNLRRDTLFSGVKSGCVSGTRQHWR